MPGAHLHEPIRVNADGARVAVGGMGSPLTWLFDKPTAAIHVQIAVDGVSALAFDRRGDLLAAGEGYCPWITVMDLRDGSHRRLIGHLDHVTALAFTPDSTRLVSASDDGYVIVWRTSDWSRIGQATLLSGVAGEEGGWCLAGESGALVGSPGFERYVPKPSG